MGDSVVLVIWPGLIPVIFMPVKFGEKSTVYLDDRALSYRIIAIIIVIRFLHIKIRWSR